MHLGATPLADVSGDREIDAKDREFFLNSVRMVASFANSNASPVLRGREWPDFSSTGKVLVIDEEPSIQHAPHNERRCGKVFPFFSKANK